MRLLIIYLAGANLVAFLLMAWDKRQAELHRRRISERTLLLWAALGGSLGSWTAIYFFRHKTRHPVFYIGIPAIFTLQLIVFVALQEFGRL